MSCSPGFVALFDDRESALGLVYADGMHDIEVWRLHLEEGGRVICWCIKILRRQDGHILWTRLAASRKEVRQLVDKFRRGAAPPNSVHEREIWPFTSALPAEAEPQPKDGELTH